MKVVASHVRVEGKRGLPNYSHAITAVEIDVELEEGEDPTKALSSACEMVRIAVRDTLRRATDRNGPGTPAAESDPEIG